MKNEIYKNNEVENKMVTIDFIEYQPRWVKYCCEMEVIEKDFEEYKNGNITIGDLIEKYEVKYCINEDIFKPVVEMFEEYKNGNITIGDLIEKYEVEYCCNTKICEPVEDMKSEYEVLI